MIRTIIIKLIFSHLCLSQVISYYERNYKEPARAKYPYLVSIKEGRDLYGHLCSGSLVKLLWVLTSAHCVVKYEKTPDVLFILAGETGSNEEQIRKCGKIYYHNEFDNESYYNDIALLRSETPFLRNPSTDIAYIPKYTMHIEIRMRCEVVEVLGFEMNQIMDKFRKATIVRPTVRIFSHTVMADRDCTRRRNFKILLHTFCGEAKNMTACLIDTGGPAVCEGLLYGITYYGCPWDGSPSYFTRVDRYLLFIEKVMGMGDTPLTGRKTSRGNNTQFDRVILIVIIVLFMEILLINAF